jgi:hypothetical protein
MGRSFVYGDLGGIPSLWVTFICLSSVLLILSGEASAVTYSFSRDGDAFTSASGSYATADHCDPSACGWVAGTQVIVGVYNTYYPDWGGSVTYTFDLSGVPLASADISSITVRWPSSHGKGLHSPYSTGGGSVSVNGHQVASLTTDVMQCGDWFAHDCYVYFMSFDVPVSYLSSSTSVRLETFTGTAWDVGPLELSVAISDCTSGPCCDTYSGTYMPSGSQPAGYSDFYDCEGTNSPTETSYVRYNDYYCSGTDADAHLQAIREDTCGTCEYCESGVSWCRNYESSASCGICSRCDGDGSCSEVPFDDSACGTIDCSGWYVQTGTESAIKSEHCYSKADITSSRCEGLGDCKDANTADCNSQPDDVLQYSCDACKYISVSSCTGTILGACSNYPSGTPCDSGKVCDDSGNCGAPPACDGTDTSCGIWPTCNNCNDNDGCVGSEYRDYYCLSNTAGCGYTADSCTDCSCSCGNYDRPEAGYCSDGLDNDCDGLTDSADPECCSDECVSGRSRCNGNYRETCGNYDADPCLEWGGSVYCPAGCSDGQCLGGRVTVQDGKIYVDGAQFTVKGACYAPWVYGTGPDPNLYDPFPEEYGDVTARVTDGGSVYVRDYSGDGKIQMWEVIQYDLEVMKAMGVNTVRTYASGAWHDKDLDGVVDRTSIPETDEFSQGDLPEWALDQIVQFCEDNDMMVVIGYWVQEENFQDENPGASGYQLECDADDLMVAKDTLKRVVQRYAGSPAVLAWGIGNEVHGSWNHGWFTWTVDINSYINDLYAYVRSLDTGVRPIMYSPYIGEASTFNNLDADIMAPNAYTHSAGELVSLGTFSVSAPQGSAYVLGEFGHYITDASEHWTLAQQYAGGFFLEYNNVWWKGEGHAYLGAVDENRNKVWERYSVFYSLYKGRLLGDVNGDCVVDLKDLALVGMAYRSRPGDAWWNAAADLDESGNIGIVDLAMVGMHYGNEC